MWQTFIVISTITLVGAIRVPVDRKDDDNTTIETEHKDSDDVQVQPSPIYYPSEETEVDSYLIPPDTNKPQENVPDTLVTPAAYLLPPSPEKQSNFYYSPTEAGESEWLPIANTQPIIISSQLQPPRYHQQENIPLFFPNQNLSNPYQSARNTRVGRFYAGPFNVPLPAVHLEPPPVNAPNDYLTVPPKRLEELNQPLLLNPILKYRKNVDDPIIAISLTPPRLNPATHKMPKKLYPKKYNSGFKPVPIPVEHFSESLHEIPRGKPINFINPVNLENEKKHKNNIIGNSYQSNGAEIKNYEANNSAEQEASESNHRYPERNTYSAPIRQAPLASPQVQRADKHSQAPDDRTEFRMHGMKGPHSYQFGYDTGKGKNRQFRYEERDNDGQVKGHYGYMDKYGKLRIVNYSAHPDLGFHAEAPRENE